MGSIGTTELIVVLIIVLVLFGGRKIPEIMRGIGEGLREFRKASSEATSEIQRLAEEETDTTAEETTVVDAQLEDGTDETAGEGSAS